MVEILLKKWGVAKEKARFPDNGLRDSSKGDTCVSAPIS